MDLEEKNKIITKIEALKNDFTSGSSEITLNALSIFIEAIKVSSNSDNFISEVKQNLIDAKPAMPAIRNIIGFTFEKYQNGISNPEDLFNFVVRKLHEAGKIITNKALEKIKSYNHKSIITCSYSSNVIKLLKKIQKYSNFRNILNIFSLESIWNVRNYSLQMKEKCSEFGMEINIIDLQTIDNFHYDFAIIGADSFIPRKGFVNGIPTKALADYTKSKKIPFLVLAESFKKHNEIRLDEGFEFIPLNSNISILSDGIF
jgi:translation initiation factor 2B subunit (eIF-2B alpha/beta/delta family)